jgi:hypothetical protein
MTVPLAITIRELSVPVASREEARRVAAAFSASLAQLHAADQAEGLGWRSEMGDVSLHIPDTRNSEAMGNAIARAVREQLLSRKRRP